MMGACKACHDPLTLTLDPEESGDEGETVPDDLVLPCGCHFHWQCLIDEASAITASLACPSCNNHLPTSTTTAGAAASSSSSSSSSAPPPGTTPQILTHYTNEGGAQPHLDIYPSLLEEAFLAAHPEARPARALHTLASEGDVEGIVSLLTDMDSDPAVPLSAAQLLAWRDPLNGGRGALHVALEARQEEVVWLVLWLGSGVAAGEFPEAVVQVARAMGLERREGLVVRPEEDVRFVRDESGRTAGDVCLELGGPWAGLVEGGLFG